MWCGRVEWWIEPLLRTGSDGSDEIAKVYTPFIYLFPGSSSTRIYGSVKHAVVY